jgi:hypothetical protein
MRLCFNYILLIWYCCLALHLSLAAQQRALVMLSALEAPSSSIALLSQPFFLAYSNDCLKVNSGVTIWTAAIASGLYTYPCILPISKLDLTLHLFPNPTSGRLTIRSSLYLGLDQYARLLIYNQIGQLVYTKHIQLIELQRGLSIDMHSFPAGTYFITVNGNTVRGVGQVVKINH